MFCYTSPRMVAARTIALLSALALSASPAVAERRDPSETGGHGVARQPSHRFVAALGRAARHKNPTARLAANLLGSLGGVRFYDVLPGVIVPPDLAPRFARIAARYFGETGKPLMLTSGTRDARRQAAAMYAKVRLGVNLNRLYGYSSAVKDIDQAWRQARRDKGSRDAAVEAMAERIDRQVEHGVYVSRHLLAGALDVRSRGIDRSAFLRAARGEPGVKVLVERRPPHFHLSFR